MVAEPEANNRSEQGTREEHATSRKRWTPRGGRGCPNVAVARPRANLNELEGTGSNQK